jgi:outer membrane protein OmpA-like peptidoglycan-associated protein
MNNAIKYVILFGSLCYSSLSFSQNSKELDPGYYVVVAAYAKSRENVAQNFVEVLRLKGLSPSYGFNSKRNLYFVYLNYFDNLKESLQDMKHTRSKGDFTDAWVRVVAGDIGSKGTVSSEPPAAPSSPPAPADVQNNVETQKVAESVPANSQTATTPSPSEEEIEVTENGPIKQYPVMTLGNTEVFLSLYNARNNRIVDGTVEVVDTDRARMMTKVKGNEYLLLPDPKSKSGQLTLICEAFGYRKIQQEINYPLPLADTVKPYIDLMGTTLVINFDLVRYHKGDIATLYNVYFYNDAALMLPESKFELGSLLQLMNENPNYRIRLHGHTNGSYTGKIFTVGQEKNFFSLDGAKQSMGSAKDLSRGRAEVIRDFLVSNGVNTSRMEIKAWGGKRPIYDKNSANAKKNVRVEVEILEE